MGRIEYEAPVFEESSSYPLCNDMQINTKFGMAVICMCGHAYKLITCGTLSWMSFFGCDEAASEEKQVRLSWVRLEAVLTDVLICSGQPLEQALRTLLSLRPFVSPFFNMLLPSYHEIFRSHYHWQKVMLTQEVKVRGQRSRSHPNLAVSRL